MNFELNLPIIGRGTLTTAHPQSSYGKPVFVREADGIAYGSGDLFDTGYGPDFCRRLKVKDIALSASQYTGVCENAWPEEVCKAIELW